VVIISNLRTIRKERGYKVKEISDILGFSQTHYSAMESGNKSVSQEVYEKLSDFYGVSVDYLMGRESKEEETIVKVENPDIRAIARASKNLSPADAEQLRKYTEFMFPDAFKKRANEKNTK
jgi:transcriptional regulator with XRE-family HTH domain